MDWNLYWTIIWQIVLACVILAIPLGGFFLIVGTGIERGLSKPRRQDKEGTF